MRDLAMTCLIVILTVPVAACALIPMVQDLSARRRTRRERRWLAQWRTTHTHQPIPRPEWDATKGETR